MKLDFLSLRSILQKIRAKELKVIDVAEHFSQNIQNKANLNAFIYFNKKQVLDDALQLDKEIEQGQFRGRLHGGPLVIKDNIHMKGIPNTAGCPALANFIPKKDANVVDTLRREGALFLGKANMHELAFGVTSNNATYGPARNAHCFDVSAGGSSGGTGSAVGAKLAPAGLGSDTGGSIRIPASVNGIAGLRPTLFRYSQSGVTPLSITRDTTGPMATYVEDLILLDEVITGETFKDNEIIPNNSLKGIRLGVSSDYLCADLDPEVEKAFQYAKDLLAKAGAILVEVNSEKLKKANAYSSFRYLAYETYRDLGQYLLDNDIPLTVEQVYEKIASPDVKAIFKEVLDQNGVTLKEYITLVHVKRPALKREYQELFCKYNLNALVFPTLPCLPIRFDEISGNTISKFIRNMDPGSQAGIPGLSIPMAKSKKGLPIGIEFDGLWNYDHFLLKIGLLGEKIFKF